MALGFEQRYADLAARFNANLAGTYPFVQAGAPVLTEATPQAVRDFFTDYGGEIDTMVTTTFLLGKADDQWRQIDEFLMRMITLRDFFTASLAAPANGKPLLLQFAFTRFRDYDSANNAYSQIASGNVRTGSMEVGFFAAPAVPAAAAATPAPATLQWSFGDSLSVDLHWARDSEYVPVLTQGSHFAQDAADPYHLIFMEGGNWALPHLVEKYRSGNGVLGALGETGTTVLEFNVTLRRTADTAANPTITTKTLLIPVTVLAQDAVTQAYQPTNLPTVYPSSAPPLTPTRRLTSNL
jgi:hypothetical protein